MFDYGENKYRLIAHNSYGACVTFFGNTHKEVLNKFDNDYTRSGWQIDIETRFKIKRVKKTYR